MELEKGKTSYITDNNGNTLTHFCVGCDWGDVVAHNPYKAVVKEGFLGFGRQTEWRESNDVIDVDIDVSCVMFDDQGKAVDHVYSPLYQLGESNTGMPNGKMASADGAIRHADCINDDLDIDELPDIEALEINLDKVSPFVKSIVFFMNIYNDENFQGDFSEIPYVRLRIFGGTPEEQGETYASRIIPTQEDKYQRMRSMILGKISRCNDDPSRWRLTIIGDAYDDKNILTTLQRLMSDYNK